MTKLSRTVKHNFMTHIYTSYSCLISELDVKITGKNTHTTLGEKERGSEADDVTFDTVANRPA